MLKSIGVVVGSYLLSLVLVLATDPLLARLFPGDLLLARVGRLRISVYNRSTDKRVRYESKKGVGAMKVLQIIGAILIAAGLYVLVKGASYPSDKSLFKVGDVEAKIEQHHEVPPWVGGVGIAAGVVLVVVGFGKRSA